jgi:hypothetical protein
VFAETVVGAFFKSSSGQSIIGSDSIGRKVVMVLTVAPSSWQELAPFSLICPDLDDLFHQRAERRRCVRSIELPSNDSHPDNKTHLVL